MRPQAAGGFAAQRRSLSVPRSLLNVISISKKLRAFVLLRALRDNALRSWQIIESAIFRGTCLWKNCSGMRSGQGSRRIGILAWSLR
jgi:hypothetical protein